MLHGKQLHIQHIYDVQKVFDIYIYHRRTIRNFKIKEAILVIIFFIFIRGMSDISYLSNTDIYSVYIHALFII
jgi:hypothetical protein